MGLTISWVVRCNDLDCVHRVVEEAAKFSEKHGLTHEMRSPSRILSCTGKETGTETGACFEFIFEPWEKAMKQSYVMKRAKFRVFGFGEFDGAGTLGHSMPKEMMKLIDGRFGSRTWQTLEGEPNLGKGGYQTGNFEKTQYEGIEHHIVGCRILDNVRKHADKMLVEDDGHFCGDRDKHDLKDLMDNFESYTGVVASISGQLKAAGWKDDQVIGKGKETSERLKTGR